MKNKFLLLFIFVAMLCNTNTIFCMEETYEERNQANQPCLGVTIGNSADGKGKYDDKRQAGYQGVEGSEAGAPQGNQQESASAGSMQGLEDRVFLIMQVDKKKAYVNEIIPVTIKLYINRLTIRDIQFPELLHEGFSVDTFDKPNQYREALGGVGYDVIEFNTNIFATRPGELSLGPATLRCNLLIKKTSRRRSRSPFLPL